MLLRKGKYSPQNNNLLELIGDYFTNYSTKSRQMLKIEFVKHVPQEIEDQSEFTLFRQSFPLFCSGFIVAFTIFYFFVFHILATFTFS